MGDFRDIADLFPQQQDRDMFRPAFNRIPNDEFEVPEGPFVVVTRDDFANSLFLASRDVMVIEVEGEYDDRWLAYDDEDVSKMEHEGRFVGELFAASDFLSESGDQIRGEIQTMVENDGWEDIREAVRADRELWEEEDDED